MIELKGLFPVKKQTKKAAPRAATKKGGGLLAIAKSIQPKPAKNWLDDVTPQQREEIIETCRAIVSGELAGSINAIADAWVEHGIKNCSRSKLKDLVAKVRRGDVQ